MPGLVADAAVQRRASHQRSRLYPTRVALPLLNRHALMPGLAAGAGVRRGAIHQQCGHAASCCVRAQGNCAPAAAQLGHRILR